MARENLELGADSMNELLLSDDELDLIWLLPYITEKERLRAIAEAQLEKILESKLLTKDALVSYQKNSEAVALARS
jgi:hypothetical protein